MRLRCTERAPQPPNFNRSMTTRSPYVDKIDNETTSRLPAIEFHGDIRVVDREEQVEEACRYLAAQPLLGFDTETRPSFRAGVTFRVSLLQLSSPERCYLFRLNRIALSKPILQLLENGALPKIGADVAGDLRSLHQLRHFREAGFIDLQAMVGCWGIEEKSLRKMSAIILGKRVSKAQRLSNWESSELTDKQQLYAATDAWVCTKLYRELQHVPQLRPLPAEPLAPTESGQPAAADASAKTTGASAKKRGGRSRKTAAASARTNDTAKSEAAAQTRVSGASESAAAPSAKTNGSAAHEAAAPTRANGSAKSEAAAQTRVSGASESAADPSPRAADASAKAERSRSNRHRRTKSRGRKPSDGRASERSHEAADGRA